MENNHFHSDVSLKTKTETKKHKLRAHATQDFYSKFKTGRNYHSNWNNKKQKVFTFLAD